VDGLQTSSANHKSTCGLIKIVRFADIPQMWQFADLLFADPSFFAGLKTSANPQVF
jgi:hypothetical protein